MDAYLGLIGRESGQSLELAHIIPPFQRGMDAFDRTQFSGIRSAATAIQLSLKPNFSESSVSNFLFSYPCFLSLRPLTWTQELVDGSCVLEYSFQS